MILASLLLAAMLAAPQSDAPMTGEEVVRRVAAGEPVDAILADVKARPAAFDVSDEVLAEMRRAGVPEVLLREMVARMQPPKEPTVVPQLPDAPTPAPPPPPTPLPPMAELRLTSLEPEVTMRRRLDPQVVAELELPAGALEADALGLAILCKTQGHHDDPDRVRWPEGKQPKELGDARLLRFLGASEGDSSGKQLKVMLGKSLAVPLLAGVSHDIDVVVLLRAGGTWVVLNGDTLHGVRAAAGTTTGAELEIKKPRGGFLPKVDLRRPNDVALPELPRAEGWAREGALASKDTARTGQAFSPDGRKRVVVAKDGARLEIEGEPAGVLAFPAQGDVEVLWSPDARVVALTAGSASASSVAVWRIQPDDAVHAVPLPDAVKAITALSALGFAGDGARMLLIGRDGGRLTGYLVNTADGTLASRFTELEVRARWGGYLGPRLR